jgi:tripartite ATP-independent transporter DctM subunit
MNVEIITILMFLSLVIFMIAGLPIAFGLGAIGVLFAFFLWGSNALGIVTKQMFGMMSEFSLVAIPLFVFMAYMLERSGIGENLYNAMHKWFGPLKGGLAMGTVCICTVIAAMSGLSATGTLTMGVVSLPAMLKRGYDKSIALGCISAGGALGALIPPSVPMVVYGMLAGISIGQLFLAGIIPGILLSFLFVLYIGIRSYAQPNLCPALPPNERANWKEKMTSLKLVILPVLLVIAVLGSIFAGIATPTEAAAIGAFGSIICAIINRKFTWENSKSTAYGTMRTTAMLLWIMCAAAAFTSVYTGLGAVQLISDTIKAMNMDPVLVIIGMQVTIFLLGMIMDPNGILLITVPIYAPIAVGLGFDPIWFGLITIMNMETSYLTPPFGWNIFYLKSVAPPEITLVDIYKSVVNYVALQLFGIVIVFIFPIIALWLPRIVIHN